MILRRITFGEALPGMRSFANLLLHLNESVAYCNRSGPLGHDRVTDYPFAIPALGLDFMHPTPLQFVRADPPNDDPLGIFRWHHAPLYFAGARSAGLDPVHVEAARLCDAIYARPETPLESWNGGGETNGVVWALKLAGRRAYVVFRGSLTLLDWLRDLVSIDPAYLLKRVLHRDGFGAMWDGFTIGMDDAWAAIKAALDRLDVDEVIFTGHSLGADRASVAAGSALLTFKGKGPS
jgi:hypothetical protein